MATRRQGLKRIKKCPLSERSEFRTLPVSVPGGACSPCEARTALVGPAFGAGQKRGAAAGTNTRLPPTAVNQPRLIRPADAALAPCFGFTQPLRGTSKATATVAARNVKGNGNR